MASALQSAIDNNVGFYQVVLGSHGIDFRVGDQLAYTRERTPAYYSNAVTRSEIWRPDEAFGGVARRAEEEGWNDWSIKDSFAVLDLTAQGFEPLFRAEWLVLAPAAARARAGKVVGFKVVRTPEVLSQWLRRWDADPSLGSTVFKPALLSRPDVLFVAGYVDGDLVAGCIVNRTGSVLGLSNCFSLPNFAPSWSDAAQAAFRSVGAMPVVGYARGDLAATLKETGFASVGQLQVWRHRSA